MKPLCSSHRREANEWAASVQDLALHGTMRPLDDQRKYRANSAGGNAISVARQQLGLIRSACATGKGCA